MTVIVWDRVGDRVFETGVDCGVFYPPSGDGVPWNGLISVNHTPSGGDPKARFIDGYKFQNRSRPAEYAATIEAYTYPPEFEVCNGLAPVANGLSVGFQQRRAFGLSYRTKIGNDEAGENLGYKIHLVYNALASPSSQNYGTMGDNPEALSFNWNLTTKPIKISGRKAASYMVVDTTKTPAPLLTSFYNILYGSSSTQPRLPQPSELVTLFTGAPTLFVINNGNGTFTVSGPDAMVRLLDLNRFQFDTSTVVNNGDGTFDITSL